MQSVILLPNKKVSSDFQWITSVRNQVNPAQSAREYMFLPIYLNLKSHYFASLLSGKKLSMFYKFLLQKFYLEV